MARSNAVGKLREIIESQDDPKTALLKSLGSLDGDNVLHSQVLVALHPGSKYHGGTTILRTDQDLLESRYQGTVGLVLKIGAGAFKDAPGAAFHGQKADVGDWVVTRPADGTELFINQVPCRLFEDVSIKMVTDTPDKYW